MTTPLSTATPKSAMKPTLALTLKLKFPTTSATIPPMSANGMFRMMSSRLFDRVERTEEKQENRANRDRDDDGETFHGALLVLELAAPTVMK